MPEIQLAAEKSETLSLSILLNGIAKVVPNLRYFYVTGSEVSGDHISISGVFVDWNYLGLAALYALLYVAVGLILASFFFSRRDFI